MCPSIECPNCGIVAYHRGSCESCDYDPMKATFGFPENYTFTQEELLSRFPKVTYQYSRTPFQRITFYTPVRGDLVEVIYWLNFDGPIYHQKRDDFISPVNYGIDLVKKNCDKFFSHMRPMVGV